MTTIDPEPGQPSAAAESPAVDSTWRTLREAAAVSVSSMSARLAEQALALVPHDHPDRLELLADQARSMLVIGDLRHAADAATEAASAATDELSAVILRSRATLGLITMAQRGVHRFVPPLDPGDVRNAVERCTTDDERRDLAISLVDYSMVETLGGHSTEGARTAATAADLDADDRVIVAGQMSLALEAMYDGRFAEAVGRCGVMMSTFERSEDQIAIVGYGAWLIDALVHSAVGATEDALRSVGEGRRMTTLIDIPMLQLSFAIAEINALFVSGRWADALSAADHALEQAERVGNRMFRPWVAATVAQICAHRGDRATATQWLDIAASEFTTQGMGADAVCWAHATLARHVGDDLGALHLMRSLYAEVRRRGLRVGVLPITIDLIRMETSHGDPARAAAIVAAIPSVGVDLPVVAALVDGARALVDADPVRLSSVAREIEQSVPMEAARLHHDAARCALAAGDPDAAAAEIGRATAITTRLGAVGEHDAITGWAQREGITIPVAADGGVERLTVAERRVAALVCAGHSNKEIARLLGVSTRTIEKHLTHIYTKLGVDSRLRLMSAATSLGLPVDPA